MVYIVAHDLKRLFKKYDYELLEITIPIVYTLVYKELENDMHPNKQFVLERLKETPYNVLEALRLMDLHELVSGYTGRNHSHDIYTDDCIDCLAIDELVSTMKIIAADTINDIQYYDCIYELSVDNDWLKVEFLDLNTVTIKGRP